MKCECEDMGCDHYDVRDTDAVARCQQEATQAILFHERPDGQEYCLTCATFAAETLEDVAFIDIETGELGFKGVAQ